MSSWRGPEVFLGVPWGEGGGTSSDVGSFGCSVSRGFFFWSWVASILRFMLIVRFLDLGG